MQNAIKSLKFGYYSLTTTWQSGISGVERASLTENLQEEQVPADWCMFSKMWATTGA